MSLQRSFQSVVSTVSNDHDGFVGYTLHSPSLSHSYRLSLLVAYAFSTSLAVSCSQIAIFSFIATSIKEKIAISLCDTRPTVVRLQKFFMLTGSTFSF